MTSISNTQNGFDLKIALPNELTRVWWIGCGLAGSMPFPAAGIHTESSKDNAHSKMLSSYTPSIRTLAYARAKSMTLEHGQGFEGPMLLVAMRNTPKGPNQSRAPHLPGVMEEKEEIGKVMPPTVRRTINFLDKPRVDEVLTLLKECQIAHFACHGVSDAVDPSNGLILQKAGLTGEEEEQDLLSVYRIAHLELKKAKIAYLSACSTASNSSLPPFPLFFLSYK
jgi:CHAT domain-containing protein